MMISPEIPDHLSIRPQQREHGPKADPHDTAQRQGGRRRGGDGLAEDLCATSLIPGAKGHPGDRHAADGDNQADPQIQIDDREPC